MEEFNGFEEAVRPLIEWMNNNTHPHTKIIIDHTSAEIVEGAKFLQTLDYVSD